MRLVQNSGVLLPRPNPRKEKKKCKTSKSTENNNIKA